MFLTFIEYILFIKAICSVILSTLLNLIFILYSVCFFVFLNHCLCVKSHSIRSSVGTCDTFTTFTLAMLLIYCRLNYFVLFILLL